LNFISLKFLLLLTLTYSIYWNLKKETARRTLLIVSSCVFYSFFSFPFLLHLLLVISLNYFLLKKFGEATNRVVEKSFFGGSVYLKFVVAFNVFNLALFKYFYFLLDTIGSALGIALLQDRAQVNQFFSSLTGITSFDIVLPMTISYYTFQLISLSIDYHKKEIKEPPTYFDFLSYILLFPIMIAGPILRYNQIIFQFKEADLTPQKLRFSIWLIILGISKTLISKTLSTTIFPVFARPDEYSGISLLLTSYLFAINLYMDFSGLTDMARGVGGLFGLNLPENFKAPFFLQGFGEFWRRWHLTFSFWIRDYIYIPLGGSRCSNFRNTINLLITFTLGGVWHGASMNFVLWGTLTGLFIAIERFLDVNGVNILPKVKILSPILRYVFVLHIYMISWVLFFTKDIHSFLSVGKNIVTFSGGMQLQNTEIVFYAIAITYLFHRFQETPEMLTRFHKMEEYLLPLVSLVLLILLVLNESGNMDNAYGRF